MNTTTHTIPDPHHFSHTSHHPGVGSHLLARWPSVVGLLALISNASGGVDSHVTAFIIIVAATCYLAAAALGSRRSGWVMVGVVSLAVIGARLAGLDPTLTVLVMGAGVAIISFFRGTGVDRRELVIQALAFAGYSAIALTAMMSTPVLAAHLAALAAIGHGAWDVVYWVRGKVVSRSLAEACFVLDVGLGVLLLLTVWGVI